MNWKLVSAFATGAVLASGIVYYFARPLEVANQASPAEIAAPPVPPEAPQVAPAPAAPTRPAPVAQARPPVHRTPVREKPSPMPAPVRRQAEPVVIAHNDPPPAPAVPPAPKVEAPPAPEPAPRPAPVPIENVSLPAPIVEARVPHTVTLAAGTTLAVRIGETLSSARNQPGDSFLATLTQQLVIDGFIIAERGARMEGRVVEATQAGRGKGTSHLAISIIRLATADGQNIRIRTEPYNKDGANQAATDAAKVGGGAAIGAIIGGIAGGGKGAGDWRWSGRRGGRGRRVADARQAGGNSGGDANHVSRAGSGDDH